MQGDGERLVSVREAAALVGVRTSVVRKWVQRARVPVAGRLWSPAGWAVAVRESDVRRVAALRGRASGAEVAADLVTVREAAALVERAHKTVAHWVTAGLVTVVCRVRSVVLVRRADVLAVAERVKRVGKGTGANRNRPRRDPTAAELEQCIAEQMKCLPSWWAAEAESMRRKTLNVPRIVRMALAESERRRAKQTRRAA